jgi:RimK-like ATP-grasp domain
MIRTRLTEVGKTLGAPRTVILFWGVPGDSPLASVRRAVERQGVPTLLVDQRAVLETEIEFGYGDAVRGTLRVGSAMIDLAAVTGVYLRPYSPDQLPVIRAAGANSAEWRHAHAVFDAISGWSEVTPALVVNPQAAMATNDSKPNQARIIEEMGFSVPQTLVTTDETAVREFAAIHGEIIYKSVSGVRSIVRRLSSDRAERLHFVRWCPTQFQEYVKGADYRVHVVGDNVFACRITSSGDDYRYASGAAATEIHPYAMAPEIADHCRGLAHSLGLVVAGIDLRLEPEKGWYCFEVNPSPGFTYYQDATGHPIDEAIARLLIRGARPN